MKFRRLAAFGLALLPTFALCDAPTKLSKKTYDADQSVILLNVNWGRAWGCAGMDNAQLLALNFMKLPIGTGPTLDFSAPSKLRAKREFVPLAVVMPPGEYALAGFEVLVARSKSDTGRIRATPMDLLRKEKQQGGSFTVESGEVVYIGHFGLDCVKEPIPWRYYVQDRAEFERYVAAFRNTFPFMIDKPVQFRLFETTEFGTHFALDNPVVR